MADLSDPKAALLHHLRENRADLIEKLDGLSERDTRLPRTATGTNLLGIVKHCLNTEANYFGPTFGREFPGAAELVPMAAFDNDPQADWYAAEQESLPGLLDLYRRVGEFVDETVDLLPLDAAGRVPWWRPGAQAVTLQRILIHVTCDVARHAGHADILREQHDRVVGLRRANTNVPDGYDWSAYLAKLTTLADRSDDV